MVNGRLNGTPAQQRGVEVQSCCDHDAQVVSLMTICGRALAFLMRQGTVHSVMESAYRADTTAGS
jgi:hypothetical protein